MPLLGLCIMGCFVYQFDPVVFGELPHLISGEHASLVCCYCLRDPEPMYDVLFYELDHVSLFHLIGTAGTLLVK